MRTLRCFTHEVTFRTGAELDLPHEESRHLSQVLRARAGMTIELLDGCGGLALAEVLHPGKSTVTVVIRSVADPEPPPPRRIELAQALTRTDAFDDMLHRAVELGITAFRPLTADHAVVELDERKVAARLERWGRITREALKQSERRWLPDLSPPEDLESRIELASASGMVPLALLERETGVPPLSAIASQRTSSDLMILVGPEGGWSDKERKLLTEKACPVSLGGAILRTETASLAALALVSL